MAHFLACLLGTVNVRLLQTDRSHLLLQTLLVILYLFSTIIYIITNNFKINKMGEPKEKKKEIYTYEASWPIYGMNWSSR